MFLLCLIIVLIITSLETPLMLVPILHANQGGISLTILHGIASGHCPNYRISNNIKKQFTKLLIYGTLQMLPLVDFCIQFVINVLFVIYWGYRTLVLLSPLFSFILDWFKMNMTKKFHLNILYVLLGIQNPCLSDKQPLLFLQP